MERFESKNVKPVGHRLGVFLLALGAASGMAITGCGKDCRESVRLGDFEYSQGNYANAAKRYEQALRDDPKCYNAEAKLKDARDRAGGK
jgi:tetratricopeptide (TPR) repeat protein